MNSRVRFVGLIELKFMMVYWVLFFFRKMLFCFGCLIVWM